MRTARVLIVSPSMLWAGGVSARGGVSVPGPGGMYLVRGGVSAPRGRGVCSQGGVPGPGGCLLLGGGCTWSQGGVCSGGVSAMGGGPGPGGVCSGGCTWSWGVSALGVYLVPGGCQVLPPCEQNDKQVQKILPCPKLRLRAVKIKHIWRAWKLKLFPITVTVSFTSRFCRTLCERPKRNCFYNQFNEKFFSRLRVYSHCTGMRPRTVQGMGLAQ